ncbi:MAG: hypothetical protein L3J07_04385 [Candidatus Magasanikbacteria bacterium]|nr:hypothetical protein [Candidatus Magasanikbacteria bacterium]
MCSYLDTETRPIKLLPTITEQDLEDKGFTAIENKISRDATTTELITKALKTERRNGYNFTLKEIFLGVIFLDFHNSETELEIIIFEGWRENSEGKKTVFFTSKKLFVRKNDPEKEKKIELVRGYCLLSAFFDARLMKKSEKLEYTTFCEVLKTIHSFLFGIKSRIILFCKKNNFKTLDQ